MTTEKITLGKDGEVKSVETIEEKILDSGELKRVDDDKAAAAAAGSAPEFVVPLKDKSVKEDSIVKLFVQVKGKPEAQISWFKNDKPIKDGGTYMIITYI